MKLEFYGQIFEKDLNINVNENLSFGSQFVLCGHMDRHGKANVHLSQF